MLQHTGKLPTILGVLAASLIVVSSALLTEYVHFKLEVVRQYARMAAILRVEDAELTNSPPVHSSSNASAPLTFTGQSNEFESPGLQRLQALLEDTEPNLRLYAAELAPDGLRVLLESGRKPGSQAVGYEQLASALAGPIRRALDAGEGDLTGSGPEGRKILYSVRKSEVGDLVLIAAIPVSPVWRQHLFASFFNSVLWLFSMAAALVLLWAIKPVRRWLTQQWSGYRAVLEASPDGILVFDRKGEIWGCNPEAIRLTGSGADRLAYRFVDELWMDPERVRAETNVGRFLEGERPDPSLLEITELRRVNGEPLHVGMKARHISLAGSKLLVVIIRDITRPMRISDELTKAKETAEKAASDRAYLLAGLSHEIRNPLSGALGMLDLLAQSPPGDERARYLNLARSSVSSILNLAEEILEWSRIESERADSGSAEFDPLEIIEGLLNSFRARAQSKGFELHLDIDGVVPERLYGDFVGLRHVLSNLLDNAIKYTERGSVELRVRVLESDDESCTLECRVKDTGIGIPESAGQAIFEPFMQANSSKDRAIGGTGLGLSICQALVQRLNGEIGYESVPGEGSTFWVNARFATSGGIEVVLRSGEAEGVAEVPSGSDTHTAPAPSAGDELPADTATVLLVDKDPLMGTLCRKMIESLGVRVDVSEGAEDACAKLDGGLYRLVIVACYSTGANCLATANRIRNRIHKGIHNDLPLVGLVKHRPDPERPHCQLPAGTDDCLDLPCTLNDMKALLHRWQVLQPVSD
ncbi:MAG: ATP-binding protein [Lysobacterales bacterium]|jgi:PAS domain S-box-containing protein